MTLARIPHWHSALQRATTALRDARLPAGYWEGTLSSSALATATAVGALAMAGDAEDHPCITRGLAWLARTQNPDGGWGDTPESPSHLATTLLGMAAIHLAGCPRETAGMCERAEEFLTARAGATPEARVAAVTALYGTDRTFAAPILMACAAAGCVPWEAVPALPFELAVIPPACYPLVRLQVVSYALPALIAVGAAIHRHAPTRTAGLRQARTLATPSVLRRLEELQPASGGFLEAIPLTSFVTMALQALDLELPTVTGVTDRCLAFLRAQARADGSWPVDANLSVWVTSNAVIALREADPLAPGEISQVRDWLTARQLTARHPYTGAAPGGWSWTHLPGGVPDVDDTAGAILALSGVGAEAAIADGARWLLGVQNVDGGWPTFCRGWGQLPFDRSTPDLTAHVLRALTAADPEERDPAIQRARARGVHYLWTTQRADGAWVPLWFGNQASADQANPVLGTARVLRALDTLGAHTHKAQRAVLYLAQAQNADGGWGGAPGVPSSVEETALTLSALSAWAKLPEAGAALMAGVDYLVTRIQDGSWQTATPLGLYFASLWYSEALYPLIWTVEGLGRALTVLVPDDDAGDTDSDDVTRLVLE
jgi:squalene-hopene/tetraprenyl-beta-curcumene cyclase